MKVLTVIREETRHVAVFISGQTTRHFVERVCALHQVPHHDAAWSPQFLKIIIECIDLTKSLSFIFQIPVQTFTTVVNCNS
jgi:hypothetical protein